MGLLPDSTWTSIWHLLLWQNVVSIRKKIGRQLFSAWVCSLFSSAAKNHLMGHRMLSSDISTPQKIPQDAKSKHGWKVVWKKRRHCVIRGRKFKLKTVSKWAAFVLMFSHRVLWGLNVWQETVSPCCLAMRVKVDPLGFSANAFCRVWNAPLKWPCRKWKWC